MYTWHNNSCAEVFHHDCKGGECDLAIDNECPGIGYYWASGYPGCLWDSDPCGPFENEAAALYDYHDGFGMSGECKYCIERFGRDDE